MIENVYHFLKLGIINGHCKYLSNIILLFKLLKNENYTDLNMKILYILNILVNICDKCEESKGFVLNDFKNIIDNIYYNIGLKI